MSYLAGIEAGGTKINCAIGTADGALIDQIQFPTTSPNEVISHIKAYFIDKPITSLGLASFGPIDVRIDSPTYGHILNTPKTGWSNFDFVGQLSHFIKAPIVFDTDVNGAALAETFWGAAKGLNSCVYVTIGTGIGGGACLDGHLIHGLLHPEMGHFYPRRHPDDYYSGHCPFHKDCLEGLASGPAIEARTGKKAYSLDTDDSAWIIEAYYLAQAVMAYTLILSPDIILLGGGVMKQQQLFPMVRQQFNYLFKNYIHRSPLTNHLENYITYPSLGDFAGLYGSLALAKTGIF